MLKTETMIIICSANLWRGKAGKRLNLLQKCILFPQEMQNITTLVSLKEFLFFTQRIFILSGAVNPDYDLLSGSIQMTYILSRITLNPYLIVILELSQGCRKVDT